MRVDLRRGQARVPEHLLDRPKIGAALEQMSGRAVPQTMRPHVRGVRYMLQDLMNRGSNLARVDPATSSAEEQSRPTDRRDHLTSTELQPSLQRGGRGH